MAEMPQEASLRFSGQRSFGAVRGVEVDPRARHLRTCPLLASEVVERSLTFKPLNRMSWKDTYVGSLPANEYFLSLRFSILRLIAIGTSCNLRSQLLTDPIDEKSSKRSLGMMLKSRPSTLTP